jgi:hypothetical protein
MGQRKIVHLEIWKKMIVHSNLWMWLVNEPWPHNHSVELGMQYKEFVLQVA